MFLGILFTVITMIPNANACYLEAIGGGCPNATACYETCHPCYKGIELLKLIVWLLAEE